MKIKFTGLDLVVAVAELQRFVYIFKFLLKPFLQDLFYICVYVLRTY